MYSILDSKHETEKQTLENEITIEEIIKIIKELAKNKSPGSDGLPVEFYIVFWNKIKTILYNSLKAAFQKGHLSKSKWIYSA